MHRHSISWLHGCRYRTTLAVVKISCICVLVSCKPIAREEPTSDAQLAILLKGMAGWFFAPILGAKKAIKHTIDSLATAKRPVETMTFLDDIDWHLLGVKVEYRKRVEKLLKDPRLAEMPGAAKAVKQQALQHYANWAKQTIADMQKALRSNSFYQTTANPALGDRMVSDPKLDMIKKLVEKNIKLIETPPEL